MLVVSVGARNRRTEEGLGRLSKQIVATPHSARCAASWVPVWFLFYLRPTRFGSRHSVRPLDGARLFSGSAIAPFCGALERLSSPPPSVRPDFFGAGTTTRKARTPAKSRGRTGHFQPSVAQRERERELRRSRQAHPIGPSPYINSPHKRSLPSRPHVASLPHSPPPLPAAWSGSSRPSSPCGR